jgi:hypothetical protein
MTKIEAGSFVVLTYIAKKPSIDKDTHIRGFIDVPVVEVCHTEMQDGSYWSTRQLYKRKDVQDVIDALQSVVEFLPE